MLKVDSKKAVDPAETTVGVKNNELRFLFNKYSPCPLTVTLKNLKDDLQERQYTLTKTGDFITVVFKKAQAKRWGGLFDNNTVEGNIIVSSHDKAKRNGKSASKSPVRRQGPTANSQAQDRRTRNIVIYDGSKREGKVEHRTRAKSSNVNIHNFSGMDFGVNYGETEDSFTGFATPNHYITEKQQNYNDTSIIDLETRLQDVQKQNAFKISHDILKRKRVETQKAKVPLFTTKSNAKPSIPLKNSKNQAIDNRIQRQFLKNRDLTNRALRGGKKPVKRCEAVSAVQLDQNGNTSFQNAETETNVGFGSTNANAKINANKKEVLNIFNELKLDVKWINREIDMMSKSRDKAGSFIEFQHKIIKILAIKLKAERKSRFTAEQQFDSLMTKFATQQEFIDKGL